MRILTLIMFICIFMGCRQDQHNEAPTTGKGQPDTLSAFLLSMDSAQKTISLPGELLPYQHVQIRAKIQGYVRKLNVDIGSRVSKGQVLALIDAPEINSHIQEMNEKVKSAEARFMASKDYFDRINTAAQANGVIAPSEYQRVRNQFLADSTEYRSAMLAASALRQTGEYLTIVAPFAGIITKRNIITGSFVGNISDQPLFELEDNSILRLQVAVPELYSAAQLLNHSGELSTRSLPDKKFKAKLARKDDIIDHATRTETWEFEVPNATGELIAGSYAEVKLHFFRSGPGFILPGAAIATTLERKFVIRVKNNLVQWVDVRTGFNMGDRLEVFGDLHSGDTLLRKATEELKPGTRVVPKLSN